jgi:hypothetical protein
MFIYSKSQNCDVTRKKPMNVFCLLFHDAITRHYDLRIKKVKSSMAMQSVALVVYVRYICSLLYIEKPFCEVNKTQRSLERFFM